MVLAITAGLSIAGFTILATISSAQARTLGSLTSAGIVLALAATSATLRLGLQAQPELAGGPAASTARPLDPLAGAAVAIDPEERAWLDRLQHLMETERAYREEGLGIAALAARLSLPEYRLRRLINQRLGHRNFNSFVNGYRLAETIAALSDPSQLQVPILTIALDAGFQSIGPFNRAFKAQTGMTPTDFRRERLERNASASRASSSPISEIGEPFEKSASTAGNRRDPEHRPAHRRQRVNPWRVTAMQTIYTILYWSTPAVIALAAIEAAVLWAIRRRYDWRAELASLADLLVRQYVVYVYFAFGPVDLVIGWVYQHRIATVPLGTTASIAALFVGQEFCYYWFHRCSHRCASSGRRTPSTIRPTN